MNAPIGTLATSRQALRRPMRQRPRSLTKPTTGSDTASQTRANRKTKPMAATDSTNSTSVANLTNITNTKV